MTITIEQIRAKYPNPIAAKIKVDKGTYCVGGALCQFIDIKGPHLGSGMTFPRVSTIALALQKANPGIQNPYTVADNIVSANDSNLIEIAWNYLDEALKEN